MSVCYFDAYILPTIQFDSRQGRKFPSRQQALYCSPTERSGFGLRLRDTEYMHRAGSPQAQRNMTGRQATMEAKKAPAPPLCCIGPDGLF